LFFSFSGMWFAGLVSSTLLAVAAGDFSGSVQVNDKNFASASEGKGALVFFLAPW